MKSIFKIIINTITLFIFIILSIISIAGGILFYKASNAFLPLKQGFDEFLIYDDKNNLVSSNNKNYSYASLADIDQNIINAFIAIEDKKFYKHNGFNTNRIIKTLYTNLTTGKSAGASTITQQYVKNVYLTNEKTLERKINEIVLAIEIEKRYTKDQILEAYLNSILFGGNIYGIKSACEYYFNKPTNSVSISEAAYLAGMIQAPNYYNAYNNLLESNKRKNIVIKEMYNEGFISYDEYQKESSISLDSLLTKKNGSNSYLSGYLDYIYDSINSYNEINKIYTYLDTNIQKDLYDIVSNKYNLFNDDNLNCAIVVLDNKTYGIKAMIGNRNQSQRVLSYAYDVLLQPGSTIKPILDYAPAFEYLSYSPATIIEDSEYTYSDGNVLRNYDHQYLGNITIRKALADSRNVPAVKLFNLVGHDKAFCFANKLGIYSDEYYEADAIGGAKNGYTLLSLANAYLGFANLGYYKKASAIKEINYNSYNYINDESPKLVMKPTTAFLINNILHDVFKNSSYNLDNTYLMAKTGQTNYDNNTLKKYNIPDGSTKDSLLIGYTKDLCIGIWVGYNYIDSNNYLDRYKKNIPRSIMKLILGKYAQDNLYYDDIEGIEKRYIEIADNKAYLAKDNGYYEYFIAGTEPLSYYNNKQIV